MLRKTRMYLPNVPVHVVQGGHNRDDMVLSGRPDDPLLTPFSAEKEIRAILKS